MGWDILEIEQNSSRSWVWLENDISQLASADDPLRSLPFLLSYLSGSLQELAHLSYHTFSAKTIPSADRPGSLPVFCTALSQRGEANQEKQTKHTGYYFDRELGLWFVMFFLRYSFELVARLIVAHEWG